MIIFACLRERLTIMKWAKIESLINFAYFFPNQFQYFQRGIYSFIYFKNVFQGYNEILKSFFVNFQFKFLFSTLIELLKSSTCQQQFHSIINSNKDVQTCLMKHSV